MGRPRAPRGAGLGAAGRRPGRSGVARRPAWAPGRPAGPAPGQATPAQFATLTQRESEVLRILAQGASNAEIAEQLIVSRATVKSHVAAILEKLGLRDRIQAVVLCYETGFVRPGEHQSPPTPT